MEQLKQVLDIITTHATCELDIRQDLVVQSEVCDRIADDNLPTDHKKRRSVSVGMSPIFGKSSPLDRNRGRKQLQRVRSWRLRYYKHRSLSPTATTTKRLKPAQGIYAAAASRSTSVGSSSLQSDSNERIRSLRNHRKMRSKDVSTESSTPASSAESDDGLTPARLAKDTLCSTIASKTRKSSRAPLALKVARSLTLADIKLLGSIHPRELVERRWRSKDRYTLAPNVMNAIKDFDRRVNWVISILLTAKPGKVQTTVKFFLAVADNLLKFHNFNGYMQIAYGICSPWLCKGRWKTECESLRPKHRAKWMELRKVADISSHRFTEYRTIKRSVLASDRSKCARRVPCWNVLLSDIHGVDAKMKWFLSGKKEVEGSRINVTKMLKLHKCMQNNLYCGHMGGYANIKSDASFDHQVKQSLAASLSEKEILKIVQRERALA